MRKAGRTNVQLSNQGYTYNEAGLTYNEAGVTYGGVYGSDIQPLISKATLQKPISNTIKSIKSIMSVGRTNKLLEDQGYTYNEAGFTYNQTGVTYGGVYLHDISPIISKATIIK